METQNTSVEYRKADIDEVGREMELLEQYWHETSRQATRACADLATNNLSEFGALALITVRDHAQRVQKEIMRQIEALEDSLLD